MLIGITGGTPSNDTINYQRPKRLSKTNKICTSMQCIMGRSMAGKSKHVTVSHIIKHPRYVHQSRVRSSKNSCCFYSLTTSNISGPNQIGLDLFNRSYSKQILRFHLVSAAVPYLAVWYGHFCIAGGHGGRCRQPLPTAPECARHAWTACRLNHSQHLCSCKTNRSLVSRKILIVNNVYTFR